MYDYIKGQVTRVTPEYVVLEQQGIGYQLFTPNPYAFRKSEEIIQVFTYLHIREDAQQLMGFPTLAQRELFRKLILVSGIGPKGALAILASGEPTHVIQAIEREDESFLVKFPGVGKKTARQMILDLKGKLNDLIDIELMEFDNDEPGLFVENESDHELEEAILALTALGYSERELSKIRPLLKSNNDLHTTDEFMKKGLQLLFSGK
ncbi:Holliday junction branch migration protein RuvA [Psychrobacillus sp. FSL K6-2684]|uniref:Holliday junction branch migration complex subunit RuvA n=1 Tax=Psychrobacillus faecigallinarum TaxID=2762235 RepID=A0ABR8R7Y7_9BACI|nr:MULTISPECIES: Holliday junction branch migration protein RuvA [Psychrobacillus]MBD7943760.1 Holliday junction branch migration protein RuvA [Psychrobacillus faecigallinarum]QEY19277.1 Holliday junction branch migration protein RuvA [Psychrobacillus sp. AK 1817]